MKLTPFFSLAVAGLIAAALPVLLAAQAAEPTTLTIFAAGTLAVPFKQATALYQKQNPGVTVQAQFGGSVKMAKQITDLHQDADILAVADYNVIPKYMFGTPPHAGWYAGFARNAITFVYTDKSKFANEINAGNWYKVLARPGVEIGRSNPDTDPSGYQTVQMLALAEKYYNDAGSGRGRAEERAARQYARHRDLADRGAAARPDRLSGDLPLRCLAASSEIHRLAGSDQSQRSGRAPPPTRRASRIPRTATSPARRSSMP